uniref:BtpA/SgcQ family protein n=1 Tax=Panagrellus redivivus TaxID=6233 RepID=A0A7E4V0T5_PANRE
MSFLKALLATRHVTFGMIHVPALPGTPLASLSLTQIEEVVRHEAEIYRKTGVNGIILENMHDLPYTLGKNIGPEIVASMTRVSIAAKSTFLSDSPVKPKLLGIQILAGANEQAIAVAHAAGLDFIRAESFVFSHVADEGWMDGCAGPLLRYRKQIGAEKVAILTDIKKKHSSHAVTSDVGIGETAHAAEFFLADGVIVTGFATGDAASPKDIELVKSHSSLPVFVGSGVTAANVHQFSSAKGFIVGSHFKVDGRWQAPVDPERVAKFVARVRSMK